MMAAQKEKGGKKQQAPALDARREMSKTKEQVEEEMKISLSIRIKPLDLDAMDSDELKGKALPVGHHRLPGDGQVRLRTAQTGPGLRTQGAEGETKDPAEKQGHQEGSGPRGLHRQAPAQDPHVLQVRASYRHPHLRRP